MKFLDKRADKTRPVSEALLRLKDLILEKMRNDRYFEDCFIMVCDYDPKLGRLEHLQMNFEPPLEDGWIKEISKPISVMLLENTEWKRYAWGVWVDEQ